MRVVVTGGSHYTNRAYVFECLEWFNTAIAPIDELVDGVAEGVDSFASEWAIAKQVTNIREPAKWRTEGLPAGIARNGVMLRKWRPDYCLAWAGNKGTHNMVRICTKAGIGIQIFDYVYPL